ncbi:electron transfer flavoprotein, partial [[Kitasatospora] papulosa]
SDRRAVVDSFVLQDLRRLRRVPRLVFSDRVQQAYPGLLCDLAQGFFTVDNPRPKPRLRALARSAARRHGVRLRHVLSDSFTGWRSFG